MAESVEQSTPRCCDSAQVLKNILGNFSRFIVLLNENSVGYVQNLSVV
jgi:hypothetical protein